MKARDVCMWKVMSSGRLSVGLTHAGGMLGRALRNGLHEWYRTRQGRRACSKVLAYHSLLGRLRATVTACLRQACV